MVDFNIRRGLSTDLFIGGKLNPNIELEEGCWYLCTDTAELFICVLEQDTLKLKKINDVNNVDYDEPIDQETIEILITEVNTVKESLANFATKQYVTDSIANSLPIEDLAKKEDVLEVKAKLESEVLPIIPTVTETVIPVVQKIEEEILPAVQELTEKAATQEWVSSQLNIIENNIGYVAVNNKSFAETIDEIFAKKSEIPPIDGLATETFVTEKIAEAELAAKENNFGVELYKVDFNAPDYNKAVEACNNGKVLVLINAAPDTNSYAIMNFVSDKYISFTKFLMSRSGAYGTFNTYYLSPENTWELTEEVRLNKVEANVADEATGELVNLKVGKDVYKLPDLNNYVTTESINQTLTDYVTNDYIQNQNYVTNTYIEQNYSTTEQIANTYVTNEKVNEVVTNEVNSVIVDQIETKVTEVIQEKVDTGELDVRVDAISYGDF